MIDFDDPTAEKKKGIVSKLVAYFWPFTQKTNSYRFWINTNKSITQSLKNIDKVLLYGKDPCEAKYDYIMKNVKMLLLNILRIQRSSFEYSTDK